MLTLSQKTSVSSRSRVLAAFLIGLVALLAQARAASMDQAKPDEHSSVPHTHEPKTDGDPREEFFLQQDRRAFHAGVQLDELRLLAVQHRDQVKILDSWARQSLSKIRNRQSIDGDDPLYTALDMTFRPEAWFKRDIIYIQAVPIRHQLAALIGKNEPKAAEAILKTGLVSPRFLMREEISGHLQRMAMDTRIAPSVNKVFVSFDAFQSLPASLNLLPPPANEHSTPWRHPVDLRGKTMKDPEAIKSLNIDTAKVAGYTDEQALRIYIATQELAEGWQGNDVALANKGIAGFVEALPLVNPAEYPGPVKREVELYYNKTFYGTVLNVFLYLFAMTLFLLTAIGISQRLWYIAMPVFTLAVIVHLAAMGIRWWLAGRIPIQNQFESVLGAAAAGCVIGWGLEMWKHKGFFGLAFSFVGFLAMTACFASPYVFGHDLGGPIGKVAGILSDFWLYVHVNIVIASYALIGASFLLGAVYLGTRIWHWINPVEEGALANGGAYRGAEPAAAPASGILTQRRSLRESLDGANMVILQMAFWFLGIGIICGAVWADHSWGRPWGWDPKETFALVTWIVYLIIVHIRFVTGERATVTAILSVVGFAVMLFNWIGVNFFLAGLHSYA